MAVNENDQPSVAPGSAGMAQAQAAPQPQATQQAQPQAGRIGVRNINNVLGRPFSKSAINQTIQTIVKTFNEFLTLEVNEKDPNYKIVVVDSKQSLTALSAVVLCLQRPGRSGQEYVSAHTMLIEGDTKLNNRTVQNAGQTVELVTVAGDVADPEMRRRVIQAVQESYPRPGMRVIEAGANVIHSELDVSDKDNLRFVFGNAIQACYQWMVSEKIIDEPAFNASMISGGDNMIAYLDLNPHKVFNSSGLPIRSDLSVQLQGVVQQASQSQPEQILALTQVDGFIDLIYQPAAAPQMGQMVSPFMQQMPQRYCPRFVITNFNPIVDAATMELQLLALASSSILSEGMGGVAPWMNAFKPRLTEKGEIDMRDIGAVGLEVNFTNDPNAKPAIIETKSNSFHLQDLYKLLNTALHPQLVYSIDVDEVGDMTYLNYPLMVAAVGNDQVAAKALEFITASANALTNNNFSRVWHQLTNGNPTGEKYFLNDDNRVFTGYYINKAGERKDIRDIDYLAILNLVGRKDTTFIKEWSDTIDRRDIPMEIRLDKRRRIYDSVLPGQVTIKGYARRITINPKFVIALATACKDSGLVFRPSNLNTEYYTGTEHGIANANTLYGVGANNSGLFSYATTNQNNNAGSINLPAFSGLGRSW